MPMEPIVVTEPMPVMEAPVMEMPEMEPVVMEAPVVPEIKADEFVAEIGPTEDGGLSVAMDFTEAAGASLDGQNPEDLSLNVEVMDPAGEVEMAQVSMA